MTHKNKSLCLVSFILFIAIIPDIIYAQADASNLPDISDKILSRYNYIDKNTGQPCDIQISGVDQYLKKNKPLKESDINLALEYITKNRNIASAEYEMIENPGSVELNILIARQSIVRMPFELNVVFKTLETDIENSGKKKSVYAGIHEVYLGFMTMDYLNRFFINTFEAGIGWFNYDYPLNHIIEHGPYHKTSGDVFAGKSIKTGGNEITCGITAGGIWNSAYPENEKAYPGGGIIAVYKYAFNKESGVYIGSRYDHYYIRNYDTLALTGRFSFSPDLIAKDIFSFYAYSRFSFGDNAPALPVNNYFPILLKTSPSLLSVFKKNEILIYDGNMKYEDRNSLFLHAKYDVPFFKVMFYEFALFMNSVFYTNLKGRYDHIAGLGLDMNFLFFNRQIRTPFGFGFFVNTTDLAGKKEFNYTISIIYSYDFY